MTDARPDRPVDLQTTVSLLDRIREGDGPARELLIRRFLGPLQRWARGRLPARARDLSDTDDLVQITLLAALDRVEEFEYRKAGAFLAYLRRILQNKIRDQIRQVERRPLRQAEAENRPAEDPSPLEAAIGKETLERYETALAQFPANQQEAVILRIELGLTFPEIAQAIGSPSANAARMTVTRALMRLAEILGDDG